MFLLKAQEVLNLKPSFVKSQMSYFNGQLNKRRNYSITLNYIQFRIVNQIKLFNTPKKHNMSSNKRRWIGKIEEKKISKSKNLKKFSFKKIIANLLLLFLSENTFRFFDFEIFFSSHKNKSVFIISERMFVGSENKFIKSKSKFSLISKDKPQNIYYLKKYYLNPFCASDIAKTRTKFYALSRAIEILALGLLNQKPAFAAPITFLMQLYVFYQVQFRAKL
ncbi:hypothetical protein BpHYR1_010176 [Brachionus plicatilis]|uniref:Uncharacterized protein n=1 Tax=Brachionus plicatilis TaxID=10195 RepID=A0A3M7QDV0_BRAPC|nr:hypothetical protein BpHYR1_010176 [Brachionus plicatilis]